MAKPSFSIAVITCSPSGYARIDTIVMFVGPEKGLVAPGIPYMTLVDSISTHLLALASGCVDFAM
jgi:hypothetical protein